MALLPLDRESETVTRGARFCEPFEEPAGSSGVARRDPPLGELLLGIDVGTTGAKAALVSPDGRLESVGRSEYALHHVRPGWVEQDPEDWWQAVCLAVRQVLAAHPNAAERVLGLAVSSQAPTLLPLSRSGAPLRSAMIWMDRRAEAEVKSLEEILGEGTVTG